MVGETDPGPFPLYTGGRGRARLEDDSLAMTKPERTGPPERGMGTIGPLPKPGQADLEAIAGAKGKRGTVPERVPAWSNRDNRLDRSRQVEVHGLSFQERSDLPTEPVLTGRGVVVLLVPARKSRCNNPRPGR